MRHYELSRKQWAQVEPLFPKNGESGSQWRDHFLGVNGILWALRTGAPWREMPRRFGPWSTVYGRFNRWRKEGFWQRLLRALQVNLDAQEKRAWERWHVDSTSVRASKAAAGGKTDRW